MPKLVKVKKITKSVPKPAVKTRKLLKSPAQKKAALKRIDEMIAEFKAEKVSSTTAVNSMPLTAAEHNLNQTTNPAWLLPVSVSFILNGLYYLAFSAIGIWGTVGGLDLVKGFYILGLKSDPGSQYLLQIAAMFGLMISLLLFKAAQKPLKYAWFYYFWVAIFQPAQFLFNLFLLSSLQTQGSFQNYLYFDSILIAIFWGINMLGLSTFLKNRFYDSTDTW